LCEVWAFDTVEIHKPGKAGKGGPRERIIAALVLVGDAKTEHERDILGKE
jgi:hypothetical protein